MGDRMATGTDTLNYPEQPPSRRHKRGKRSCRIAPHTCHPPRFRPPISGHDCRLEPDRPKASRNHTGPRCQAERSKMGSSRAAAGRWHVRRNAEQDRRRDSHRRAGPVCAPPASWANSQPTREAERLAVPKPQPVQARSAPLKQSRRPLRPSDRALPYRGTVPGSGGKPFLDAVGEMAAAAIPRRTPPLLGGRDLQRQSSAAHSEGRHPPPDHLGRLLHGHGATLERDVLRRQRVADQVPLWSQRRPDRPAAAVDAADRARAWEPGAFGRFMGRPRRRSPSCM